MSVAGCHGTSRPLTLAAQSREGAPLSFTAQTTLDGRRARALAASWYIREFLRWILSLQFRGHSPLRAPSLAVSPVPQNEVGDCYWHGAQL